MYTYTYTYTYIYIHIFIAPLERTLERFFEVFWLKVLLVSSFADVASRLAFLDSLQDDYGPSAWGPTLVFSRFQLYS